MNPNQPQQNQTQNNFNVPYHIHNGVDSPILNPRGFSYGCKAYLSGSNQSIPDATGTNINLNSKAWDFANEFDTTTHKYTARTQGYYLISAALLLLATGGESYNNISILVNGSSVYDYNNRTPATISSNQSSIGVVVVPLNVGDYVQTFIYQDSGSPKSVFAGINSTFLIVQRII